LVLVALVFAGSAAGSTGQSATTYGPTRDWGGTQIRSLDPVSPTPAGGSGSQPSSSSGQSGSTQTAITAIFPADQVLSNEFSFSQWAYVARISNVYASPTRYSRVITRLHLYTEDGFPEIYLLLKAHWTHPHHEWVQLRIPGRPNGRTGWVLRRMLGSFHVTHQLLVVNREALHMYLYENGRRIWSAPVGVGRPGMPTPAGHFWIRERFVIPDRSSGYYPYAFGTADYSTLTDWPGGGVVGIHGPFGATWSQIPGRISHGCIRLHIPDDFWLGSHLHLGTPLWVK
jgi:hypothetical protein